MSKYGSLYVPINVKSSHWTFLAFYVQGECLSWIQCAVITNIICANRDKFSYVTKEKKKFFLLVAIYETIFLLFHLRKLFICTESLISEKKL